MRTPPPGSPGRSTVPVRITRPVYEKLVLRHEEMQDRLGRTNVSLCEALEAILHENDQLRILFYGTTGELPMILKMDDNLITSPDTSHIAKRITNTAWRVTWLRPDHRLTRNEATTAMMIASVIGAASEKITKKDPVWGHINTWAYELGLDGDGAIAMAMRPHQWEV